MFPTGLKDRETRSFPHCTRNYKPAYLCPYQRSFRRRRMSTYFPVRVVKSREATCLLAEAALEREEGSDLDSIRRRHHRHSKAKSMWKPSRLVRRISFNEYLRAIKWSEVHPRTNVKCVCIKWLYLRDPTYCVKQPSRTANFTLIHSMPIVVCREIKSMILARRMPLSGESSLSQLPSSP